MGWAWRAVPRLAPLLPAAIAVCYVFAAQAAAAPPADYGDAPDGANAGYLGKPHVVGHFPSKLSSNGARHTAPGLLRLGGNFDLEADSRQVDQDADDDGFSATLKACKSSTLTFVINAENLPMAFRAAGHTAYLNAWLDWNRDGRWSGSSRCGGRAVPEWGLQNHAVDMGSFATNPIQMIKVPVIAGPQTRELWVRASLTLDQQFTSPLGQGSFDNGETEDYQLHEPNSLGSANSHRRHGGKAKPFGLVPECESPTTIPHGKGVSVLVFFYNPFTDQDENPRAGTTVSLINGKFGFPNVPGDVDLRTFKYGFTIVSKAKDVRANPFEPVTVSLEVKGAGIKKSRQRFKCRVNILHELPPITEHFGGGPSGGPPSGVFVAPLSVAITQPTDDPAFVGDDNPMLPVAASASGGTGPYTYSWTTSPPSSTVSGQNQTLDLSSWPISLDNGRASGSYNVTATDSAGRTANTSWNVVVACNTTKIVTGDIGGGKRQLFQACGRIDTHGVQPAKVEFTPMGNTFNGNVNIFEVVAGSSATVTATKVTANEPKSFFDNPLGFVGMVAEMANALASGQCMKIEAFDGSNASLGAITRCLP